LEQVSGQADRDSAKPETSNDGVGVKPLDDEPVDVRGDQAGNNATKDREDI